MASDERIRDGNDDVTDRVRERAAEFGDRGREAVENGTDYLRSHDLPEIRDDVVAQIREHPLVACGIALGAGYLLGSLGRGDDADDGDRDDRAAARRRQRGSRRRAAKYAASLRDDDRDDTRHNSRHTLDRDRDDEDGYDRHDRGGRFSALRSRWDEEDAWDDADDDHGRSVRSQFARVVLAGVGALLSRQIRSRIAGEDRT